MNNKILPSLVLATLLSACGDDRENHEMGYSDFLAHVENGNVTEISLSSNRMRQEMISWDSDYLYCDDLASASEACSDGNATVNEVIEGEYTYTIIVPANENVYERVSEHGVEIIAEEQHPPSTFFAILPLMIFMGFFMAWMTSGIWYPKISSKLKRLQNKNSDNQITFDDIAGIDEALEETEDIVDFLKDPQKYRERGLKIPKGLLLTGPPGNGKTLMAKAIANEAGVPFIARAGSEFNDSMYMGVGTGKIKEMFAEARSEAKKHGACIIFVDEFDAIGLSRSGMGGGGSSAGGSVQGAQLDRENQVNQLLVELDGFDSKEHNIVLLAATNRPDVLDPALTRPGRIDRQAHIGQPDITAREKILGIYLAKHECEDGVDAKTLAKVTYNFSGAQLANLVNEAGLLAFKDGRKIISYNDIEAAKDKMLLGKEFKTRKFSELEKDITTYHEAGHLLLSHLLPHSMPVYKATIVPRGKTLGVVHRLPESDVSSQSMATLKADLAVAMAGRAAEELVFGRENVTTGAQGDFQQADNIARAMVYHGGMSSDMKPYYINAQQGLSNVASQEMLRYLDDEKEKLLSEAMETAKRVIKENWDDFIKISAVLKEKETLTAADIAEILGSNVTCDHIAPNLIHPDQREESAELATG